MRWPIRPRLPTCANQEAWVVITSKRSKVNSIHTAARHAWTRPRARNFVQKAVFSLIHFPISLIRNWPLRHFDLGGSRQGWGLFIVPYIVPTATYNSWTLAFHWWWVSFYSSPSALVFLNEEMLLQSVPTNCWVLSLFVFTLHTFDLFSESLASVLKYVDDFFIGTSISIDALKYFSTATLTNAFNACSPSRVMLVLALTKKLL